MAEGLTAAEAAELQTFLQDNYNTPSDQWLEGLRKQCDALKALLEQGVDTVPNEPKIGTSEQARTPAASRAAALPVVRLVYRTFLIGTDEHMPFYGIGTISPSSFADIFWQKVDEVNNENGGAQVEVYVAHDSNFEFRFGGYVFHLMYFQSEDVARRYPEIVKADPALLKERAGTDDVYKEILPNLILWNSSCGLIRNLGLESTRRAFYFLRAHAIERGTFYNLRLRRHNKVFLHAQYILGLLDHAVTSLLTKEVSITLQSVIAECFHDMVDLHARTDFAQCPIGRDLQAECTLPTLIPLSQSVLTRVRALTMDMKMDFPRFVKIDVEYNGSSSIQRGVFLAMVERQLHKLHKNISEIVKQPEPVEQPPCVLWPSRLIETTTDSSKINSWVYVLGLKPPAREDAVFEAKFHVKVEEWSCGVASQEEFDQSSCFIKASVEDSSAMMCTLINCTQYTTPKAIHGPKRNAIPVDTSESKKFPERKKNHKQERSSNEPTRSLRQASDVLSALRHDPKYDIDDFKVGYVDRFKSAIQEKPAADWQTDTQHDEFVAEHRIEYFKKCPQNGESEIWWEKKTKTDKFFKTGNSTEL